MPEPIWGIRRALGVGSRAPVWLSYRCRGGVLPAMFWHLMRRLFRLGYLMFELVLGGAYPGAR